MAARGALTLGLVVLMFFLPGVAATLPPETDPVCDADFRLRTACNAVNAFVHPETPLCAWPAYNVVPCALFANPVIQDDAGSGRDAGSSIADAVPVAPAFHRANIAPVVDTTDVFTFSANAGDSLRFRYDGAVSMVLRDPAGNDIPTGYWAFTGTAPTTGTYSIWGFAKDRPYNYYFCFVVDGVGPGHC